MSIKKLLKLGLKKEILIKILLKTLVCNNEEFTEKQIFYLSLYIKF